jgi:DNA polymerase elongation subunit (family B)
MIKKYYCSEKGIQYKELPRKGYFRKSIDVKNCIAKYVVFETPQLKEFLKKINKLQLGLQDDFKEHIDFHGNMYSFMKGGLHTENSPKIFEADEDYEIIDWDVSSYYPAIIINNGKFPAHLGKEFLRGYKQMFEKRLELKPLAKSDKKIKGIVGALKLAVNSVYGKSSDMLSWIYDRQLTMFTTITGELSLMMLIEKYETNDIHVISANTDGVTIKIKKDQIPLMHEINAWWCELTQYELERTDYSKIIFSTVNDYLAIMTNGEIKKKGDFLTDFELHKNKSARVVPIALEQWFVHGVPVDTTIRNHTNLYDFCLRQKATRSFHYEGTNRSTGKKTVYDKLIRYYVSNEGDKIFKIKNEECQTRAAAISQVEAGEWVCKVCNFLPKNSAVDNVNYDYYIEKANRIVTKINTEGRRIKTVYIPNQLNLF